MNHGRFAAAIWGATGAAGREVLQHCLQDERVREVRAFTRRSPSLKNPLLKEVQVDDFLDLSPLREELRGIDVVYWCLGVSQSAVPDEGNYRKITQDYALAGARTLLQEGPDAEFHFVSGMGADRTGRSRMMWARIKGETEASLLTLGMRRLVFWRPGFVRVPGGRTAQSTAERLAAGSLPYCVCRPT